MGRRNKPEENGPQSETDARAAGNGPSAGIPERAAPAEQPSPTILIEPELLKEAVELTRRESDASVEPASAEGGEQQAQSVFESSELSALEADHFADSFRPSWETADEPGFAELLASQGEAMTASEPAGPASDTAERAGDVDEDALPALSVSRSSRKTWLLLATPTAAVALVIWVSIFVATEEHEALEQEQAAVERVSADQRPAPSADPAALTEGREPMNEPAPVVAAETAARATEAVALQAKTAYPPADAVPEPGAANEPGTEPPVDSVAHPARATPAIPARLPEKKPSAPRARRARRQAQRNAVHVRVTTTPASAQLSLDGTAVPNPFDAWVARSGGHRFSARADGYIEQSQTVSFEKDRTVSLVLSPASKPAAQTTPPAREKTARTESARPRTTRKRITGTTAPSRKRGAAFATENPY